MCVEQSVTWEGLPPCRLHRAALHDVLVLNQRIGRKVNNNLPLLALPIDRLQFDGLHQVPLPALGR